MVTKLQTNWLRNALSVEYVAATRNTDYRVRLVQTRMVEIILTHVQNRTKTVHVRAKTPVLRTPFDPDAAMAQLNEIGHDFSRVQVGKGRFTFKCRRCFLRGERTFLKQLLGKPCSSRPRGVSPARVPVSVSHKPDEPESFFIGDTPSSEGDPFGWGGDFDQDRGQHDRDHTTEMRGWKLFFLLPRILLHRPPRGGFVPKAQLQERVDKFLQGHWIALLETSLELSVQGSTASCRRRRTQKDTVERRATRAFDLCQLGELSSARQALEGAATAPASRTEKLLKDESREKPNRPFHFGSGVRGALQSRRGLLLKNLRTARRGAAAGPSGMTAEHYHLLEVIWRSGRAVCEGWDAFGGVAGRESRPNDRPGEA